MSTGGGQKDEYRRSLDAKGLANQLPRTEKESAIFQGHLPGWSPPVNHCLLLSNLLNQIMWEFD